MDTNVLQSIDLFPITNTKNLDNFIDNSSNCLKQISSISFWDTLDNTTNSQEDSITAAFQVSSALDPSNQDVSKSPRPVKAVKTDLKKAQPPESKTPKISQDLSALDCCDYWLRFDSDDDSLEPLGDYDNKPSSTTRRPFGPTSELSRLGRLGQTDVTKLAHASRAEDWMEDSALDHALSSDEESFSMALDDDFFRRDSTQASEAAPEGLYSTPLNWEPPHAGVRADSYFGLNPILNDPERQRLLAIAMGTGMAPMAASSHNPAPLDFTFDIHTGPATLSDTGSNPSDSKRKGPQSKPSRSGSLSGQTTPGEGPASERSKDKPRNSDRAAHNDIERKYRTNLKDRITDLREAVPSLRSIPQDHDDDGSPVPVSKTSKVSKGTILTKATDYIHQLERRNRRMGHKNEELLRRLRAFEQLLGASQVNQPTWTSQGYGAAVFNPPGYTPN